MTTDHETTTAPRGSAVERRKIAQSIMDGLGHQPERLRALGWTPAEFSTALINMLDRASHGLSCPYCHSGLVAHISEVFVEEGGWAGSHFAREGYASHWGCQGCGHGFIEWTPSNTEKRP